MTSEQRELVSGVLGGLDRDLAEFRVTQAIDNK
jgi:hypothetical protein